MKPTRPRARLFGLSVTCPIVIPDMVVFVKASEERGKSEGETKIMRKVYYSLHWLTSLRKVLPEKWKLLGDWMNTCSCDPGCPCLFWSDPTTGSCEAIDAFHFRSGNYGRTSLAGLNAVMVSRSPGNIWKGNWQAAMYLDERAKDKQREALEIVLGGKAGGVPLVLSGMISSLWGMKYAKVTFDVKKRSVNIPSVVESILDPNVGGDKKKPITVGNHPFTPAFGPMSMGKSKASKFNDYGQSWDHAGKDGNWASFIMKGP